jgi:hypothetical protein
MEQNGANISREDTVRSSCEALFISTLRCSSPAGIKVSLACLGLCVLPSAKNLQGLGTVVGLGFSRGTVMGRGGEGYHLFFVLLLTRGQTPQVKLLDRDTAQSFLELAQSRSSKLGYLTFRESRRAEMTPNPSSPVVAGTVTLAGRYWTVHLFLPRKPLPWARRSVPSVEPGAVG